MENPDREANARLIAAAPDLLEAANAAVRVLDPELLFLDRDGRVVRASTLVANSTSARFGVDGNRTVAELRPKHAGNPPQVIENLRRAIEEEVRRNPDLFNYDWYAGPAKDGGWGER